MSSQIDLKTLGELRKAYQQNNLTLYLGAGVSSDSGLPSWDKLILAMYFRAASGDWKPRWSPFPNYLYAIAEWQLQCGHEPLEITAQKIRQFYSSDQEFFEDLRTTLYSGLSDEGSGRSQNPQVAKLCRGNPTLDGVAKLCCETKRHGSGLHAVVTYNYDNLLEILTAKSPCSFVPVWKSSEPLKEN